MPSLAHHGFKSHAATEFAIGFAIGITVVTSLAGAAIAGLLSNNRPRSQSYLYLALSIAAMIAGAVLLIWDGNRHDPPPNASAGVTPPALKLPDPSLPGPHKVRTLTYGSGTDKYRPEFAAGIAIKTHAVDGSPFVENWKGRAGWARSRFWGFDSTKLPLQGRVWYPDGPGPFPLALFVHGNHPMEDFSDPGYAYLGELMASRGIIFVSVDQNFLNYSTSDLLGFPNAGLRDENDARAWMRLEHIRLWSAWNKEAGNPFWGHVDTQRIALLGHSRGGEAAAIAAVFNRLPNYPDDARIKLGYNYAIRGIAAIAPTDGKYKPAVST